MTEAFQPGQHPDADQLSAFAEGALPAHERESTLLHLAGCAHCRQVVSLALPTMEEDAPVPAPARVRTSWLARWSFAWPALAAGCAALLVLAVHLHNARFHAEPAPQQTASASPPGAVTSPPSPPEAREAESPAAPASKAPSSMPQPAAKLAAPTPPAASAGMQGMAGGMGSAPQQTAPQTVDSVIGEQNVENLPVQGRNAAPLQQGLGQPQGLGQSQQQVHGQLQPQNAAAPQAAPPAPVQMAAAPPRAAAPVPPPAAAASTVEVNAGAMAIDTADAVSFAAVIPARMHRLPSHLAVASAITRDRDTLALDTAGGVFLSTDTGRHWKPVATPWLGRAASVTLAAYAPQDTAGYTLRSATGATGAAAPSAPLLDGVSRAPQDPASSLTGVITDATGAAIPGALATLTNSLTGAAHTNKANKNGCYAFGGVAPGTYTLTVSATGFQTFQRTALALGSAPHDAVDVRLSIGSVSQTVTVEAGGNEPLMASKPATRRAAKAKAEPQAPVAAFEVTLANGERWTSLDGLTWSRR